MLLFFAISGLWQMFNWNNSGPFQALSSVHTMKRLKAGGAYLSSPLLKLFVLLMAISFIVTTLLGVIMALKFGRSRRAALLCIATGILIPILLILLR